MKSTIAKSKFSWNSYPEKSNLEFDHSELDMPLTKHLMPPEVGEGWFQTIHLPLNMVIRRGIINFRPEVSGSLLPIATVEEHFCEPVLSIQSARKGRVVLLNRSLEEGYIFGQENCLFEHIEVRDNNVRLDASENLDMTTLLIGDSVLRELLGNDDAQALLRELRVTAMPGVSVNKIPRHISAILHSSIPDHLTGNIAKLHIQAKILDYLCALVRYVVGISELPPEESATQRRIEKLYNDLVHLEGKLPSLNELAKQYDLSLRNMKDGFSRMYGKSLFSYIAEVRLNKAHAALLNSDIPMKVIAKNLGFSHVNHFNTSFSKQFGYSPGSLRGRNRKAGSSVVFPLEASEQSAADKLFFNGA